jgi:hypothetical protein
MKAEFYLDEDQKKILNPLFGKIIKDYVKNGKQGAVIAQIIMLNDTETIKADCYLMNEEQALHIRHLLKKILR